MAKIILKDCPFCGGEAGMIYNVETEVYAAWCLSCGVVCKQVEFGTDGHLIQDIAFNTCEEAAEAWNRRYNEETKNDN